MVVDPLQHYADFEPPPPAPTFEPTEEEFKDPLAYINKIRPIARNFGVIKIKPPVGWQPPFVLDTTKFEFHSRVQKLNEVEAISRIRLAFLNKLANFWHLQGSILNVPALDNKWVDLHSLHKAVKAEGGFDATCAGKRWAGVAKSIGLKQGHGASLKGHYEKILLPYDIYESGIALQHIQKSGAAVKEEDAPKPAPQMGRMAQAHKRLMTPRELRNLKFSGAGPKAAVVKEEAVEAEAAESDDPMDDVVCRVCASGSDEDRLLLCDACDGSFHTYCLIPPLANIPKGNWRCPPCVTKEVKKPHEAFGFEQAERKYTLHAFGLMADKFKKDFFGMDSDMVPQNLVEKEFWKQVVSPDAVAVKYGADLFSSEVGSGFPKEETKHLLQDSELPYVGAAWNLNNLPILEESVLRHMTKDISGVMVPWVYVGMLFSTFCWHVEDHWSYSINYLHWGESKFWYGIAESEAEKFETAMRELAPELFAAQPDLLHHIVTLANPRLLLDKGVKVTAVRQHAGEFVVTFPRAYHAGFNQGYNFAEAVNFCPADWLSKGRECVEHYRGLRRENVFCHDELVLSMSAAARLLSIPMALACYKEMHVILTKERGLREAVAALGVSRSERAMLEERRDEERACASCRTTLFLSALACSCHPDGDKLFCLTTECIGKVCTTCAPSSFRLRYRYSLDELPEFVSGLAARAEEFESWKRRVEAALAPEGGEKPGLESLKELLEDWRSASLPSCEPYRTLKTAVAHADKCSVVAEQLIAHKIRTRTRHQSIESYSKKLKLEEVEAFALQMEKLPCIIKQRQAIKDFVDSVHSVKREAEERMAPDAAETNATPDGLTALKDLFHRALGLDLQIPEIFNLKTAVEKNGWLVSADAVLGVRKRKPAPIPFERSSPAPSGSDDGGSSESEADEPASVAVGRLRELLSSGLSWPGEAAVEARLSKLQHYLQSAGTNEETAGALLASARRPGVAQASAVLATMDPLPGIKLPQTATLREHLKRTERWLGSFREFKDGGCTLEQLQGLLKSVKGLPLDVSAEVAELRWAVDALPAQLDRLTLLFQKPCSSTHSMDQILSPRQDLSQLLEGQRCPLLVLRPGAAPRSRSLEWGGLGRHMSLAAQAEALSRQADMEAQLLDRLRATDDADCHLCAATLSEAEPRLRCRLCRRRAHPECSLKEDFVSPYLCPRCARSRRPSASDLKAAMDSLVPLPFPSLELGAARLLLERLEKWEMEAKAAVSAVPVNTDLHFTLATKGLLLELSSPLLPQLLAPETPPVEEAEGVRLLSERASAAPSRVTEGLRLWDGLQGPSPDDVGGRRGLGKRESAGGPGNSGKKARRKYTHDDEQKCSAPNCLKPIGDSVNWVQCESGCALWFHLLCVGLTVRDVAALDHYTCQACTVETTPAVHRQPKFVPAALAS